MLTFENGIKITSALIANSLGQQDKTHHMQQDGGESPSHPDSVISTIDRKRERERDPRSIN